jgi:hypothetical protein
MTTTDPVTFPFEATRPGVLIVARQGAVLLRKGVESAFPGPTEMRSLNWSGGARMGMFGGLNQAVFRRGRRAPSAGTCTAETVRD